ncbi:ELMO domain-containing protein 3-like isoform X2 [Acanthaster planci]|uniref:ELMO domain-containing protein 3-like isoform X2 n=1 Tax=Acanthaster planci TaxID=133434 RepID=A0A8B7Z4L5_ACAPL|nr:ELMO domain-containing protein 3-like isoform X2 [Acanthaster planci]
MEEEDEFDAIFQDGSIDADNENVQTDAVNYRVSMEKYQKVDLFQTSKDTAKLSNSQDTQGRASKYQVISSETSSQQEAQRGNSEDLNSTHRNAQTHQADKRERLNERSVNKDSNVSSQGAGTDSGAVGHHQQAGYPSDPSLLRTGDGRGFDEEEEDDPSRVLRAELPRDRAGTGGDPTEQLARAKAEWEVVGTIQPGNESTINMTPLISFNETLAFFQRINMQPYLSKIKPTVHRSGLSAVRHFILGPPNIKPSLHEERNLVFAIAQCPFEDREEVHRRVLQTIYKQLTGSTLDCPRYGGHWEQIGFQGADPATDLRACGFLGLMTLLHFVMDPVRQQLAKDIYKLSLHDTQNFPFSVMSINMTRIALQSLREGALSRECNRRKQVFGVINDFYAGIFLQLHQIWKHQQKTIKDSGFVIKDVEQEAKKNPRAIIKTLETYLHERGEKHSGNLKSRPARDGPLEFAGVHELRTEDD